MRQLPLFIGSLPVPDMEPYRVMWNTSLMHQTPQNYLVTPQSGWGAALKNTGVLTDHAPLDFEPEIQVLYGDPLGEPHPNHSLLFIYSEIPTATSVGMVVRDMKRIADSDRRDKLPKVITSRINHAEFLAPFRLYRYVLDNTGTKYLSVNLIPAVTDLEVQLEYCLDGVTVVTAKAAVPRILGTISESMMFVIHDTSIKFLHGDPGTELVSLDLPGPVRCTRDAYLEIFRPMDSGYVPVPDEYVGIDGLYIYDGYF